MRKIHVGETEWVLVEQLLETWWIAYEPVTKRFSTVDELKDKTWRLCTEVGPVSPTVKAWRNLDEWLKATSSRA